MPTVPAIRPVIPDAAVYNGAPDLAGVTAQVMQALHYGYTNDLKWVPSDPCAWRHPADQDYPMRAWVSDTTANGGAVDRTVTNLGRIFVPHPRSYARRLVFYLYCRRSGSEADVTFTVEGTGEVTTQRISNATLGGSSGWLGPIYVPCVGPDVVSVAMTYVSGGTEKTRVDSLCGWWETLDGIRADVTIDADAAWTAGCTPSQAYHSNGVADHSYLLKWAVRRMQQRAAHAPLVVCMKWFGLAPGTAGSPAPRGVTASVNTTTTVGRYKIPVGDRIPSLRFAVFAQGTGSVGGGGGLKVDILVNGSSIGQFSVAGGWAWSAVDSATGLVKGAVNDIEVQAVIATPTTSCTVDVGCVSIWENAPTATDLKLPGGESIPAAFPAFADDLVRTRQNLYADTNENGARLGRKKLVGAVLYLWANRVRHLVSDSRLTASATGISETTGTEIGQFMWAASPDAFSARVLACVAIQPWSGHLSSSGAVIAGPAGVTEHLDARHVNALEDPGGEWVSSSSLAIVPGTEYQNIVTTYPSPIASGRYSAVPMGFALEELAIPPATLSTL